MRKQFLASTFLKKIEGSNQERLKWWILGRFSVAFGRIFYAFVGFHDRNGFFCERIELGKPPYKYTRARIIPQTVTNQQHKSHTFVSLSYMYVDLDLNIDLVHETYGTIETLSKI